MIALLLKSVPFLAAFLGALVLTLVLTPLVREMNRSLGMVDKPDPRRINKVPIPRGGGLALFFGVMVSYALILSFFGEDLSCGTWSEYLRLLTLSGAMVAIGYIDDKVSLPPKMKLVGQLGVAFLAWFWLGLGFRTLWPAIPAWLDCLLTVFWITGAINAFNLIDGLDGLASGLALIATIGMGVTVFFTQSPHAIIFYLIFAGGLLGFLRYNYNPASVFLGDSGSMFIGFILATLPLRSQAPNSFLVSIGVPMLAMGVPIFDTSLAILRRTIRHLLHRRKTANAGNGEVMTADIDHLHHRILRSSGLNQRKAAWVIYLLALGLVSLGLLGVFLESRAAGVWLVGFVFAAGLAVKDLARIEIFDAGRLLGEIAHDRRFQARRKIAKLSVPTYLALDAAIILGVNVLLGEMFPQDMPLPILRLALPISLVVNMVLLTLFKVYRTSWPRAQLSNYARLLFACILASVISAAILYYLPNGVKDISFSLLISAISLTFLGLMIVRIVRPLIRDLFYALDCSRLRARKDVSRILVYGAGLRYRTFRRELVRSTAANERMIVGLLDDDVLLRGRYIGGLKILGTINEAPEIINAVNADTVVISCEMTEAWQKVVLDILRPTGVKIIKFSFVETKL